MAKEFTPAPDRSPGAVACNIAGRLVTIIPLTGVRAIYRDGAHVGDWPEVGYRIEIAGVCSAIAATLDAAKARGEFYAIDRRPIRRCFAMTLDAANAVLDAEQADADALMARHPFTPSEVANLAASRHHADILQPPTAEARARALRVLTG